MHALGRWSIRNHVTVNLIVIFIMVAGLLTMLKMRRELFPQFSLDMIYVSVVYPGASPEEVEEGICIKIEEQIEGLEGIARMLSTAREGEGSVLVELESGAEARKLLDEIKSEVDRITTFPEDAEEPFIIEVVRRDPTIYVAAFGEADEHHLRLLAERIRDDLLEAEPPASRSGGLEGLFDAAVDLFRLKEPDRITQVDLVGVRPYEIAVETSEQDMRRFGISFDQVVQAVRTGSVDLPGGRIKTEQGEILVRAKGQLYTGQEFEELPLITLQDGTLVRLGEVARVTDGFSDVDVRARFNGKPAVLVSVHRTSEQDVIEIARIARDYVAHHRDEMPPGVQLAVWGDLSIMVQDRIDLLLRNGTQGMLLVFLGLALFLNIRLAFWVALGIPLSFMGAFMVLDGLNQTVNMISLFAFIMTLGILVDDAIIVGENVFTHYARGKPPGEAVVAGLKEVGAPVVMAVATTVVAFVPLLFVTGIMGKFIAVMPMAVIAILGVSLFEALVILPSHLEHALRASERKQERFSWHERLRRRVEDGLNVVLTRLYTPAVRYAVRNKYLTLAVGIGVLLVSVSVVRGGYVPFVFFPKGESDWIIADLSFPLGTPYELTENTVAEIEKSALALNGDYPDYTRRNGPLVENVFSLVGVIPRRDWKPEEYGSHVGVIWIETAPSEVREDISTADIISGWRSKIGEIPGVESLTFATVEGGPAGNPIEIQLSGHDFEQLKEVDEAVQRELATYPGTLDISDNFKPGKQERRLTIRPGARSLGITMRDIARQTRQAFHGEEALRIQRGRDEVKVMVRYAESDRRSLGSIEDMRIRAVDGREIPVDEVARVSVGRAYATINRVDRKRTITVTSDIDEAVGNAGAIVADLKSKFLPELVERHPGVRFDLEGQEKRTTESMDSLESGYILALMGIFLLLAYQFRSYVQPIIIMVAIPFGLIGAIFGHLVMGMQFTMISVFGIVALSGIVVNDSLILIDFINRAVQEGAKVEDAVVESGRARFRAVLLTSLTTIAGLLPLLLERSFQAQFLVPMAVSISFGLLAATVLTLLFVPALYMIVHEVTRAVSGSRPPAHAHPVSDLHPAGKPLQTD